MKLNLLFIVCLINTLLFVHCKSSSDNEECVADLKILEDSKKEIQILKKKISELESENAESSTTKKSGYEEEKKRLLSELSMTTKEKGTAFLKIEKLETAAKIKEQKHEEAVKALKKQISILKDGLLDAKRKVENSESKAKNIKMKNENQKIKSLEAEIANLHKVAAKRELAILELQKEMDSLYQGGLNSELKPLHLIVLERLTVHLDNFSKRVSIWYSETAIPVIDEISKGINPHLEAAYKSTSAARIQAEQFWEKNLKKAYEKEVKPHYNNLKKKAEVFYKIGFVKVTKGLKEFKARYREFRKNCINNLKAQPSVAPHAEIVVDASAFLVVFLVALLFFVPLLFKILQLIKNILYYTFCCCCCCGSRKRKVSNAPKPDITKNKLNNNKGKNKNNRKKAVL